MPVLDKISNIGEGRKLKNLEAIAQLVNTFEPEVEDLTDDELRAKTGELRRRVEQRRERSTTCCPRRSRRVREAARRTIGQRHFDVQLMGGAALHQGNIAEMKTGEGKTLVSTLPGYLNALSGERRAHRHGQRLPRQARLRVDGRHLPLPRARGRADPGVDVAGAASARLRGRHHLRHEQRVRLRLPARQHGDAPRGLRAARPQLRDRRRGRLDPDRRGAYAADHQRHGAATPRSGT